MPSQNSPATSPENGQDPEPAARQPSSAPQPAVAKQPGLARPPINMSLVLCDFATAFETSPVEGCRVLTDLLRDEATCEARCAVVQSVYASDAGFQLMPGAPLAHENHFLQELVWIALGVLATAVATGRTTPERIARLTAHPAALRLARQALFTRLDALQPLLRQHGAATWHWLREEITSGRLVTVRGESVVGRHVAAWRTGQSFDELVVGDSGRAVRRAAAEQWMLPEELITASFVDPH